MFRRIPAVAVTVMVTAVLFTPAGPAEAGSSREADAIRLAKAVRPVEAVQPAEEAPLVMAAPGPEAASGPESTQVPAEDEDAPAFAPVSQSDPVDDAYFEDAVFLGDSRTEGFHLYSGLDKGACLYAVGATVESVFSKPAWSAPAGQVPLLDALSGLDCGKVYVMLGLNELGWTKVETYHDQYAKVVDRIRADHPGVQVVLQSLPPVSARQDAKGSYVNNERIREYNAQIRILAEEKGCAFVDVAECLTGEDGCLPPDLNFDGVHLDPDGCQIWLDYLRTHTV